MGSAATQEILDREPASSDGPLLRAVVSVGEDLPRPPAPAPAMPSLVAVSVTEVDGEARRATLSIAGEPVVADLDGALDPVVVRTAIARRERVIAQHEASGWVVLGALRTAPTPGIDKGDDYTIEARRIRLAADHELSVVSGSARIVLRAVGTVESVAREITARAAELNKIFGRVIRLN